MNAATEFDAHDKRYFDAPIRACLLCGDTNAARLCDIWPDDEAKAVVMCDDCATETRRVEAQADQLAGLPSCDARQQLIDGAGTTRGLVSALVSHDVTCVACASTRGTVVADRVHVNTAAVCCEVEAA